MREKFEYAGCTARLKPGVGHDISGRELSGETFEIEDWFENVVGCSWMGANGNPTALIYAVRSAKFGENNGVHPFSNDVVYGKVHGMGFAFHINELDVVHK